MIYIIQDNINWLKDCVGDPDKYPDQFIRSQIVRSNCVKERLQRNKDKLSVKELKLSEVYNKLVQKLYKIANSRNIFVDQITIDNEEEKSRMLDIELENTLENAKALLKNYDEGKLKNL